MNRQPSYDAPLGAPNLETVLLACMEARGDDLDAAFTEACGRHPELAETLQQCWQQIRGLQQPHGAPAQVAGYRILRRLGGGGMGVVYLAEQEKLGRKVAVKLIRSDLLESGAARERFHREALAASRLEHPGLCPVFEVGEADGVPFMVMPWLEGTTLSVRLAELRRDEGESGRAFATSAARRDLVSMLGCVARAAHHAHEQGLVHRDIKPANIMLLPDGRPMLLDFGLARDERADAPTLTRTGERVGTPAYMAPEQIRTEGATIDRRTDVYALGVVLYEVVKLCAPFHGSDPLGLREQILSGIRPASLRCGLPHDLASIILKAADPDLSRRYPNAAELADDLDRFARLLPVHARRMSAVGRTVRWIRRHPVVSGLLFALAVALGLAAVALDKSCRSLADFHRMADVRRAQDLAREADEELWPLDPAKVPAMERWLAKVEELRAREPLHRAKLATLDAVLEAPDLAIAEREEASWQRGVEQQLLVRLAALLDADWHKPTVAGVRKRIEDADTAQIALTQTHAKEWAEAIATIADQTLCPFYKGLRIEPMLGLVPLGRNETTRLYEFWHPASGERPKWRGRDGKVRIEDGTAIVFVLIPGGAFWMGAQKSGENADPAARAEEAPVHQVALDPFLLARHEMTQGQWERWTGENPSVHKPGMRPRGVRVTLRNPVETVSWEDSQRVLRQMGLDLPTEAQWEYACRARTSTVYWTGDDVASLEDKANIADKASEYYLMNTWGVEESLADDGHGAHAPVGSYTPNGWGLFDTHGNVQEWCKDSQASYQQPPRQGDGERSGGRTGFRVCRGGSHGYLGTETRSASRNEAMSIARTQDTGVRPAKRIRSKG